MLATRKFAPPTQRSRGSTLRMDAYLQHLIQEHTLFGVVFQNWIPLVAAIFLVWTGFLNFHT